MKCDTCGREQSEGVGWVVKARYKDGTGRFGFHEQCPERVCKKLVNHAPDTPSSSPCSRDAKHRGADGTWYCGIHWRAKQRFKESTERSDRARSASRSNERRAWVACEILKGLDVKAAPYFNHGFGAKGNGYSGDIVVDPAGILRALGIVANLPEVRPDWRG